MTLRDLVETEIAEPLVALTAALQVLRTALQREPATVEGVYASVVAWQRRYGRTEAAGLRCWLRELGAVADAPIPRAVLMLAASAED